ncbi:hypothetical protein P153DRAFT_397249 [Dothidotthia symphoricarpi CBS 119687]|uniref:Uncharacterized protein n=1 Tax=Dothidotthia symphoricarpi CBS 119687 TaxID=1392245 RepID=A0A6A6ABU3_9PLEO|nr:uncharacterized protein P153DRAFT_397249 [Dothidotthia symphoricarpi CBS 119687]KAF2129056.1 hypothetical protein P153DRAFT_397249 [Dothidotthia symphoricarpi CBS 119687]
MSTLTPLAPYDTRSARAAALAAHVSGPLSAAKLAAQGTRVLTWRATGITIPDTRVDIVLSNKPNKILFRDVPYGMLIDFCGTNIVNHYRAHPSSGSRRLILPASRCEGLGLDVVLSWMIMAYEQATHDIIPVEPYLANLLTFCCIERALNVLGLYNERGRVCRRLEYEISRRILPVHDLVEVWNTLPQGSYWVGKILDHIRRRLVTK